MRTRLKNFVKELCQLLGERMNGVRKDRRKLILVIVFTAGLIILIIQTVLAFWRLKSNF